MDGTMRSSPAIKSRQSRVAADSNGTPNKKLVRGDTVVNGMPSSEILDEQVAKGTNRFSTMKKAAEEQRRRVRETRYMS